MFSFFLYTIQIFAHSPGGGLVLQGPVFTSQRYRKLEKCIALSDRIGPKDRANGREIRCVLKHIRSFKEQLFGRLEKFDDHFASNSVVKIGDFRHRYSLKSPQRSNV